MITLQKVGDALKFTFTDNPLYLQNGTIEVPVNSLTLVTDNSGIATFKKSASNDIFVCASYDELGMTKAELETWFKENAVGGGGGGGVTSGQVQSMIDNSVSGYADSVLYNSTSKYVEFYHNGTGGTKVYEFDASDFVIDGMVDDVRIETISGVSYLVIDFNTASGKEDIQIPLTDIFNPSDYYTTAQTDTKIAEATSGKVDTDTYTAYTAATDATLSGKQDTLSAGTNISITTGETADTINCTLPIVNLGNYNIVFTDKGYGSGNYTLSFGDGSRTYSIYSMSLGNFTNARGDYSVAIGYGGRTNARFSNAFGYYTVTNNERETAQGVYNNSVSGSSTFGDSGNTLFSVGNGTADNARHNAFEIRQNGDIYCSDGTNDVKLQDTITATAANTTALGGLSLVKLTQQEYDALTTKDSNTLYVIVN